MSVPETVVDETAVVAYLDLMKRCLTRYSDGEVFLGPPLATERAAEDLETGKHAHQDADTMIGWPRLNSLQRCVRTVLQDGIPGDLLETGVWRGGSCIFMRAMLKAYGVTDRTVWVADSFQGFPPPDLDRYPADRFFATDHSRRYFEELDYPIAISIDEVKSRFRRYGLLDDQVRFLPGFFADTLPTAPVEALAVLRLDGDFYQSTYEALEAMYPRLSPGGFCIVDDYWLPCCQEATRDFRAANGIDEPIERVDWTGALWRKG